MSARAKSPASWPNAKTAVMGPAQLAGVMSIVARESAASMGATPEMLEANIEACLMRAGGPTGPGAGWYEQANKECASVGKDAGIPRFTKRLHHARLHRPCLIIDRRT